eukprot:3793954-Alexandrium_andersonii.AAC.1
MPTTPRLCQPRLPRSPYCPDRSNCPDDSTRAALRIGPPGHNCESKSTLVGLTLTGLHGHQLPDLRVALSDRWGSFTSWTSRAARMSLRRFLLGAASVSYTHLTLPTICSV